MTPSPPCSTRTPHPRDPDDHRTLPQRQADALAEVCGYVLDHGDQVPQAGGHRPHLNVHVRLEDLQARCAGAVLDYGGTVTPAALRMVACDARVIPVVLGGAGQPLDIGRATRTIPDGLRRAVAARDRGCAHPGCGRPPGWAEVSLVTFGHGRTCCDLPPRPDPSSRAAHARRPRQSPRRGCRWSMCTRG